MDKKAKLEKNEIETLKAVLNGIDDVIYVADPETFELLHVNESFENIWGRDAIGQKCFKVLQDRDSPCPFCTNDKIFGEYLGKTYVWEFQNEITKEWFRCSDKAIKWTNGKMVRFELAANISSLKNTEAELRIKNQVFEDSIAPQSIADKDGIITHVNPAFVKMWGYANKDEAIGNSVSSFFANPDDAGPVLEALGAHDAWEGEFLAQRKDGPTFIVSSYSTTMRNTEGELIGYQSTTLDVTREREAEARLKEAVDALRLSNQELEQFAYVASHDLQEPLRMVASYTQLLAERYEGQLDEKADKFIGYAVDGAQRMQRLINDLLAFSRVGTRGNEFEKTDCAVLVQEVLKGLEKSIEESGAKIIVGDLPEVMGDRTQLGQVFQNLIGNAVKFIDENPPQIEIKAKRKGNKWEFCVTDNGMGIDPQFHERVFIIFQRLHERGAYSGNGIGLSIVKKIIERHGGRIWVESEPGAGTKFIFTVPA